MVEKSELRLGQHVIVRLCGGETVWAVVDGLCNDWVGVRLDRGGYVIADWEDIGEVDAEEVVRTEQGEVLAEKKAEPEVVNDLGEGNFRAVRLPDGRLVTEKLAREMVTVECDATVHKIGDFAWVTPDDEKKFQEEVYCNFVSGQKVMISITGKL